jgi:AbrB family looped-hinge helix DNA binding protein
MGRIPVKLEKSGRILIPAEIRRKLKLKEGSEMLLTMADGGFEVTTRERALERVQARMRKYVSPDRNLSQELLEERRQEAIREDPE